MPSRSVKQQRFFGLLHAIQTGKVKAPSADLARKAKEISKQDVTDFAATKHKGLPTKAAGVAALLGKGLGALGRGMGRSAGALNTAARYTAKVPAGQPFFTTPLQSTGRVTRMLFNPHLGRYGNLIKGTALMSMITPPAVAAYNGVQAVRQNVQEGLDKATAAGIPVDHVPAGQWAKQLVHNPVPWAWRALTDPNKPPLERFADQQTWSAIKNKTWQGLHDWLPFKGRFGDYLSLATRPGVMGVREIADRAGWMPNPKTVDPLQSMRELLATLQTPGE